MSPCIEASGAVNSSGYASAYHPVEGDKRGRIGAHRLAWIQANGPIPEGMCVCHHCDNRKCINVEHLFLGTHTANMRDMRRKGRGYTVPAHQKARGERRPEAKLTAGWVAAGRALRAEGLTYAAIAGELNVHKMTVYDFCKRRTWVHVK